MRIIYSDRVSEITDAFRIGKQLIFKDCNDKYYHTGDYPGEDVARCALTELAVNGYIRVEHLHIQDTSQVEDEIMKNVYSYEPYKKCIICGTLNDRYREYCFCCNRTLQIKTIGAGTSTEKINYKK